ncbi:hypothetical protein D8B26_002326 [Coccidioides posadasii str. Silveira]|uniref:CFEM domain-containing protein n=3 Tax=Coccidioides posadasii TaxID=199306 RepID=E9DD47_COCPS|nr:CFEM domain containing protein [Coccidioides posadasii C735 delta SOWgp]EER24138.1 CFEM domain containing protein [Coccidioides posadasii C735 delta SOWgp]EFW15572.1 conserved hypothetical protein [Coccidioides posadasii str. Silveira]KMM65741.1 hypothetical protein CPAG_02084 [Coccidioides posadasii RMSCC 3488]QVM07630.1 hypothetical protein D8B26_002326 [Coccidioides posadasii str. Silveira]|eukprot:XP_003066283.1 CFEM domain containing protein [Coccidioides posadasii C735 delta SOWgp]
MKLSAVVSATFFTATMLAQDIEPILNLPACPRSCIWSALSRAGEFGCGPTDAKCLCRSTAYQNEIESCATSKCSAGETDLMRKVGRKYCEQAGAPLPPAPGISLLSSTGHQFPRSISTSDIDNPCPSGTDPNYPKCPFPTDSSFTVIGPTVTFAPRQNYSAPNRATTESSQPPTGKEIPVGCIPPTIGIEPPKNTSSAGTGSAAPIATPTSIIPINTPTSSIVLPTVIKGSIPSGPNSAPPTTSNVESGEPTFTLPVETSPVLASSNAEPEKPTSTIKVYQPPASGVTGTDQNEPTYPTGGQTIAPPFAGNAINTRAHVYAVVAPLFAALL